MLLTPYIAVCLAKFFISAILFDICLFFACKGTKKRNDKVMNIRLNSGSLLRKIWKQTETKKGDTKPPFFTFSE
jgi:hypothetical protein